MSDEKPGLFCLDEVERECEGHGGIWPCEYLESFGRGSSEDVLDWLKVTGGAIVGDVATRLLAGRPIQDARTGCPVDWEILLPVDGGRFMDGWSNGTPFAEKGYEEESDGPTGEPGCRRRLVLVKGVERIAMRWTDSLQVMQHVAEHAHSTGEMNAITGTHVVSLFPRLTFVEKKIVCRGGLECPCEVADGWERTVVLATEEVLVREPSVCELRMRDGVCRIEGLVTGHGDAFWIDGTGKLSDWMATPRGVGFSVFEYTVVLGPLNVVGRMNRLHLGAGE